MKNSLFLSIFILLFKVSTLYGISCGEALTSVALSTLQPSQSGLRLGEFDRQQISDYWKRFKRLPEPVSIARVEDGTLYLLDGHHRFNEVSQLGVKELNFGNGDFTVRDWKRSDFEVVNFAAGWVTPMKLGKDLRRPELLPWKNLVKALGRFWSQEKVESFIREHPEGYLVSDSAKEFQQVVLSERDLEAYKKYQAAMDKTMPIKVGQLLPTIPSSGIVLELGSGTGQHAFLTALHHPNVLVVAIDLEEEAVEHAFKNYQLPNLIFLKANALNMEWPEHFFDAIYESSFSHEIFSYGEPTFDKTRVSLLRERLTRFLKPGGTYGLRDFVKPDWPKRVKLKLPVEPRTGIPPFGNLSITDLFLEYTKTPYWKDEITNEHKSSSQLYRIFETSAEIAFNFLLRIKYTDPKSWPSELHEVYGYENQDERKAGFENNQMRVDFAAHVINDYMIENWWKAAGIQVYSQDDTLLPFPPSNGLLFATKPFPSEPASIEVKTNTAPNSSSWMSLKHFRNPDSGRIYDLVSTPGITRSLIPYEITSNGQINIFLRRASLRPAMTLYPSLSQLSSADYSGALPEGFAKVIAGSTGSSMTADIVLWDKAGIHFRDHHNSTVTFEEQNPFLPSPGTSDEMVRPLWMNVTGASSLFSNHPHDIKQILAGDLLTSNHVGTIPDPRLEAAAYELLLKYKQLLPPWVGSALTPADQSLAYLPIWHPGEVKNDHYEIVAAPADFISLQQFEVTKKNIQGEALPTESWEFAIPQKSSVDTVTAIPYAKVGSEVFIGLETKKLPAFQERGFKSALKVVPAWRLPKDFKTPADIPSWIFQKMDFDFKTEALKITRLGEGYFSSPGQSPEKVSPYAYEVNASIAGSKLTFYRLKDLLKEANKIPDLHTRIALYRLAHALKVL